MIIGAALMFVFAVYGRGNYDRCSAYKHRPDCFTDLWGFILALLINIKTIIHYFLRPDSPATDVLVSKISPNLFSKSNSNVLPAAQSVPATDLVMPRFNTAETVQPLSVTEPTTNLLSKKEDLY